MIVRKIRPEELKRTQELFSIAFEFEYDCDKDAMEVYEECVKEPKSREDVSLLEKYAAFLDDDKTMTGCIYATRFPMQFDGNSVQMAAVGGVSSLPQYRRMGGIRGCFTTMLPDLYKNGVTFSYLYPFSTAYYRKFGYEMGCSCNHYEWQLSFIPTYKVDGSYELIDASNREKLAEDVKTVYQVWQKKYNCMIENESWEYRFATEANPYKKQEFTYIYYKQDKTPAGYLTFRKEKDEKGQRMVCSKFVFTDVEGLKGLFALVKTFASDHYCIRFTLPDTCNIEAMFLERSLGACRMERSYLGMVRVVNVEKVLQMARYRGTGEIVLQVEDAHIPENDGIFEVHFADGRAVSVHKLEKEEKKPQLVMTIAEFSKWITGVADVAELEFCENVRILDRTVVDNGVFEKVFYKKPCFIMEYF